jgi:hypothetical protein
MSRISIFLGLVYEHCQVVVFTEVWIFAESLGYYHDTNHTHANLIHLSPLWKYHCKSARCVCMCVEFYQGGLLIPHTCPEDEGVGCRNVAFVVQLFRYSKRTHCSPEAHQIWPHYTIAQITSDKSPPLPFSILSRGKEQGEKKRLSYDLKCILKICNRTLSIFNVTVVFPTSLKRMCIFPLIVLTNTVEESPEEEVPSHAASPYIFYILWSPEVHFMFTSVLYWILTEPN